jgi:hypothetical protein
MIELATEAVNEVAKEKPVTQAERIRQFVAEHPFTKANTIAKKMGIDRQYVYTVMWNMKNKTKLAKKKKAMTNKELVDLSPALKFLEGRAQAKKEEWKTIAFGSSDIPFYEDSVTDTTPSRMAELAYEAGRAAYEESRPKLRMEGDRGDAVNHPAHYKVGGIETIDFIEAKKLNYNIGNVIKYLTRADHKGNRKQDLEKAKWYLERELSTMS